MSWHTVPGKLQCTLDHPSNIFWSVKTHSEILEISHRFCLDEVDEPVGWGIVAGDGGGGTKLRLDRLGKLLPKLNTGKMQRIDFWNGSCWWINHYDLQLFTRLLLQSYFGNVWQENRGKLLWFSPLRKLDHTFLVYPLNLAPLNWVFQGVLI